MVHQCVDRASRDTEARHKKSSDHQHRDERVEPEQLEPLDQHERGEHSGIREKVARIVQSISGDRLRVRAPDHIALKGDQGRGDEDGARHHRDRKTGRAQRAGIEEARNRFEQDEESGAGDQCGQTEGSERFRLAMSEAVAAIGRLLCYAHREPGDGRGGDIGKRIDERREDGGRTARERCDELEQHQKGGRGEARARRPALEAVARARLHWTVPLHRPLMRRARRVPSVFHMPVDEAVRGAVDGRWRTRASP